MIQILNTNGFTHGSYGSWMNEIMKSSPCEWVMFQDHDIFLANPNWYKIISDHIENTPDAGLFTCVTNRVGNGQQKVFGHDKNHDILYHVEIAKKQEGEGLLEATRPISGLIMVTSKTAWSKTNGFKKSGIIGVDNNYYGEIVRAGMRVYIMKDLYVYHKYRA